LTLGGETVTECNNDFKTDFINDMILLLMRHGMPGDEARSELYMRLRNLDIVPVSTELIPYQGDVNEVLLKRFLVAKKIKGCTDRTIEGYARRLQWILRHINKPATQITPEDVQLYIAWCMRNGLAKQTINNDRLIMSTFFGWLHREGIISMNPINRVDKIRFQTRQETAFTDDEIEKMRSALETWHDKAMFELLLSTGCRITELMNIRIDDLNGDEIEVFGKGEKYRTVYMNAKARLAIDRYLAERCDGNPYLFPGAISENGKAVLVKSICKDKTKHENGYMDSLKNWYQDRSLVSPDQHEDGNSVRQRLKKLAAKVGVDNVHPHRFRRTCATHALQRGMPLELVSKMLGHNKLDTTKIYLSINEEDLKQAHRKYVT